jgi:pimeloyl-ACP methyl ester carboxylesterase
MRKDLLPPGQMIDIGICQLHAIVRGQDTPTVILEPALSGFSCQYFHIQPGVAEFTRVMAYDRVGQGWSERSPNLRTPDNLAGELKALLVKLDIQPPYVLFGQSFGGLLTRIYAGLHPEEVAGVVLVDSTHEDEYRPFPYIDKQINQMAMGVRAVKLASWIGLDKQLTKMSLGNAAKAFSKEDLNTFTTMASQVKHYETALAEFSQHRCYFGSQTQVPHSLGGIPLIVVTAGNSVSGSRKIAGSITGDQMNVLHQQWQKDLVRLSTQGEQIIIPDATHFSIIFQPEHAVQVVNAIRVVVERARGANRRGF